MSRVYAWPCRLSSRVSWGRYDFFNQSAEKIGSDYDAVAGMDSCTVSRPVEELFEFCQKHSNRLFLFDIYIRTFIKVSKLFGQFDLISQCCTECEGQWHLYGDFRFSSFLKFFPCWFYCSLYESFFWRVCIFFHIYFSKYSKMIRYAVGIGWREELSTVKASDHGKTTSMKGNSLLVLLLLVLK